MSRRRWLLGSVVVAAVGLTVFVGSLTHWFGTRVDPRRAASSNDCQTAVRHQMTVPTSATFDGVEIRESSMFEDDHVALGFEAAKVSAVWDVTGTVASVNASGVPGRSEFDCRDYFFGDGTQRASVGFSAADESGQRSLRVG